ncbi:ketosynthase chain-length factor [Streptomyces sp. NPDC055189]
MSRRTVFTGISAVAPNGLGTRAFWDATCAGTSGIGPVTRFDASGYPATLAGEISGFTAGEHLHSRLIPQTDHMTQMALAATDWALADAALSPQDQEPFDMGVVTASSSGGFEFGQRELAKLWSLGPGRVSAYQSFAWFYAVNTGQISIRNGMKGPNAVVVSDQAGGLDALAHARRLIRKGSRIVVSGAVDASLCPWGWVAQLTSGRVSTGSDAQTAFLPFDARAAGHVPGEGGAILITEEAAAARERGARVYGELAGYAATFDARPGSGRPAGFRRVIELALEDAGATPGDIDVVFADAAAVPELDRAEVNALTSVFGPGGVPVTAPKTMTGRLHSGGAPLDVAAALLSLGEGIIPPTVHVETAPDYAIDLVTGTARRRDLRAALVLARGQGGFNSAAVIRRAD